MRLRRRPRVAEAIHEFDAFVFAKGSPPDEGMRGKWTEMILGRAAPLHVELGTGKGDFISTIAERNPAVAFVGIEAEQDVLYSAACKVAQKNLGNVRLLVFDVHDIEGIFAPGEIDRLYINFCDPWPKKRHAKRRLTNVRFLEKYRCLLKSGTGDIHFKTDNRSLFDYSLEQFAEAGFATKHISYDLHAEDVPNIMTEYERRFSERGEKINRCEAFIP